MNYPAPNGDDPAAVEAALLAAPLAKWAEFRRAVDAWRAATGPAVTWATASGDRPHRDTFELEYPTYSTEVTQLIELLHELGAVVAFDWMEAGVGQRYLSGAGLAEASVTEAARLATTFVRGERFGDGVIQVAIEDGSFDAVLSRLLAFAEAAVTAERGPAGSASRPASRAALRRVRVLLRLQQLADAARQSDFTVGVRVSQPLEVQRLQSRVRAVSDRWAPVWTSPAARDAAQDVVVQREHVVPVVVLVERILQGDDVEDVLNCAAICRVTYVEHKKVLATSFRRVHADLYKQMLECPLETLTDLGWERYRSAGLHGYVRCD